MIASDQKRNVLENMLSLFPADPVSQQGKTASLVLLSGHTVHTQVPLKLTDQRVNLTMGLIHTKTKV